MFGNHETKEYIKIDRLRIFSDYLLKNIPYDVNTCNSDDVENVLKNKKLFRFRPIINKNSFPRKMLQFRFSSVLFFKSNFEKSLKVE